MTNIGSRKIGSHHGQNKQGVKWWQGFNFFSSLDIFSKELPSFNLQRETHVGTAYGGFCTFIVWLLTFTYALIRFEYLVLGKDPNINVVFKQDVYDDTDKLGIFKDNGYRIAFVVEDYRLQQTKGSHKYVKYIATYWTQTDDGRFEIKNIPLHPCTEKELANDFYDIVPT